MEPSLQDLVRNSIREIPDFPKPGINFYDVTTFFNEGELFRRVNESFAQRYKAKQVDAIIGIEARGFIFGAALAHELGVSFVPIRKSGKLPGDIEQAHYSLEYGTDAIEIHSDALNKGAQVVIIDDLIATGGTAKASVELAHKLGAEIIECAFFIELVGLKGREALAPTPTYSFLQYEGE